MSHSLIFLTRFINKVGLIKNKLAEKDQVRMIVRNVSPNLVERLQMMNPKTFVDLYDDRSIKVFVPSTCFD